MSFILDALKKSEQERQSAQAPGLLEARALPRRGGLPWWALLLVVVLLANLGLLAWMLLRPAPAAAPASPAAAAATAAQPIPTAPTPVPVVAVTAPEVLTPPPATATAVPADELPAIELAPATPLPAPPVAVAATPPAEMSALRLSLHVYADNPAQRVVLIDGQSLREGQGLPNGAKLERITPEGAVLLWQGRRFTLRPGE